MFRVLFICALTLALPSSGLAREWRSDTSQGSHRAWIHTDLVNLNLNCYPDGSEAPDTVIVQFRNHKPTGAVTFTIDYDAGSTVQLTMTSGFYVTDTPGKRRAVADLVEILKSGRWVAVNGPDGRTAEVSLKGSGLALAGCG